MSDRFRMLPEWADQAGVLLAWPHESTDWKPWLNRIDLDYVELAVAISKEVSPLILCQDESHRDHILELLGDRCQHPPRMRIQEYNDTWCRDYGPITVAASSQPEPDQARLLDFSFNGWGSKYDAGLDNLINQRLSDTWQSPLQSIAFELEGGSIETDGYGTLLTTHHCLLDSNRNRTYDQAGIEQLLKDTLGIDRILWLSAGALIGDDTDSHIDNLARFCSADTIAYARCPDIADPHHTPLREMEQQLRAMRTFDDKPYRLVPVDLPEPQLDEDGQRLPGSYINFLILNQSVIVPVFGCPQDEAALSALQTCFPDKNLIPVPGGNLIRQFGGPHCATMQLPSGILKAGESE